MGAVAFRSVVPCHLRLCALAALWGGCALAQQEAGFEQAPANPSRLRLELSTIAVPNSYDGGGSRINLTGWSGAPAQAGVGLGLGLASRENRSLGGGHTTVSRLDLGLNWRSAEWSQGRRFNIGVWQRLSPTPDTMSLIQQTAPPVDYDTRLEMQFSAASARGIRFELGGALGMQLNNNERLVLRVSHRKPMLYYRVRF